MLMALTAVTFLPRLAYAGIPTAGEVISAAIEVGMLKKIPLPRGQWRVEAVFVDAINLDPGSTAPQTRINHVILSNIDKTDDIKLLAFEFSAYANVNWAGQPCDATRNKPVMLANDFETRVNSTIIKCNQIRIIEDMRGMIRRSTDSKDKWISRALTPFAVRADDFPKIGVMMQGYLSRMRGDKIWYTAYVNPAAYGFDEQSGLLKRFKDKEGDKLRDASAARYADALMVWANGYTAHLESSFLSGAALRVPEVAELKLTGFERAAVPTPAPVPATAVASSSPGSAKSGGPVAVVQAPNVTAPPAQSPVQAAPAVAPSGRPLNAYALVIGNSAYPGAALVNPRNDAQAIAGKLKTYGLKVDLVLDAKRAKLVDALSDFSAKAQDADVTIFFYAGHGMQVNGVNYLIPVDMNLASAGSAAKVSFEAVSLNTLVEDHLPGKTKIVFLDACRDNPLARSLAGTRGGSRGLAAVNAATGTLISYATRDGSTASDGNSTNSPYTAALLAHLDEPEDIALLLRKVRQKVMANTRGAQEPWEYGSLVGDKLIVSQLGSRR
jgi:hypothetical protein